MIQNRIIKNYITVIELTIIRILPVVAALFFVGNPTVYASHLLNTACDSLTIENIRVECDPCCNSVLRFDIKGSSGKYTVITPKGQPIKDQVLVSSLRTDSKEILLTVADDNGCTIQAMAELGQIDCCTETPICQVTELTFDCAEGLQVTSSGECENFYKITDYSGNTYAVGDFPQNGSYKFKVQVDYPPCTIYEYDLRINCGAGCDCAGEEERPVCGNDGLIYCNPCEAYCAGAEIMKDGLCGEFYHPIFDLYPWLYDEVDPTNCSDEKITVYNRYPITFIYIEKNGGGYLHVVDGQRYCQDAENFSCRNFYNLNELMISMEWTCGDHMLQTADYTYEIDLGDTLTFLPELVAFTMEDCEKGSPWGDLHITPNDGLLAYDNYKEGVKVIMHPAKSTVYTVEHIREVCGEEYSVKKTYSIQVNGCHKNVKEDKKENFKDYLWLSNVIQTANCCDNTEVVRYQKDTVTYIYIAADTECSSNQGKLYYEDGSLACRDWQNFNCVDFHKLSSPKTIWHCDNEDETDFSMPINESDFLNAAESAALSFSAFPNPTIGSVKLNLSGGSTSGYKLQIFNETGKVVKKLELDSKKVTDNYEVDLSQFGAGLYILQVDSGTQSATQKIIVLKG